MVKKNFYFITGNKGKFEQAKAVFPDVEQIDFDVCEIQEMDPKKIVEAKLREAEKVAKGDFFCEDTSLEINALGGLPGPFIKWFLDALGSKGIYKLVENLDDKSAIGRTTLGYNSGGEIVFFEEITEGEIVFPAGENGYGWDKLFKPKGSSKTLAEMSFEEKQEASMKTKVFLKLKKFLDDKK